VELDHNNIGGSDGPGIREAVDGNKGLG